jgi:hypothetical protein
MANIEGPEPAFAPEMRRHVKRAKLLGFIPAFIQMQRLERRRAGGLVQES